MKRLALPIEFILLCVFLPTTIIVFVLAKHMFVFLWGAALYCGVVMYFKDKSFLRTMWRWEAVTWGNMKPLLIRWILASIGMLAFIYWYDPARAFALFDRAPLIIPFLLVLYPLLSALPQEFIFCTFFFDRYKRFFPTERLMVLASAIVFAYAHVLFINWVAPTLSFVAGLIFAMTYSRTKSLALVTIEHGLYGNVLFLVGLGWYFHGGAVGQP